jgi:hypothetical protein
MVYSFHCISLSVPLLSLLLSILYYFEAIGNGILSHDLSQSVHFVGISKDY